MTPVERHAGAVAGAVLAIGVVMWTREPEAAPEQAAPTVHVACTADGVILWEGDAARADYENGQWTVCATSAPCRLSTSKVRTSAACVVTPLVEAEP